MCDFLHSFTKWIPIGAAFGRQEKKNDVVIYKTKNEIHNEFANKFLINTTIKNEFYTQYEWYAARDVNDIEIIGICVCVCLCLYLKSVWNVNMWNKFGIAREKSYNRIDPSHTNRYYKQPIRMQNIRILIFAANSHFLLPFQFIVDLYSFRFTFIYNKINLYTEHSSCTPQKYPMIIMAL